MQQPGVPGVFGFDPRPVLGKPHHTHQYLDMHRREVPSGHRCLGGRIFPIQDGINTWKLLRDAQTH